jgi:hypothetical protein
MTESVTPAPSTAPSAEYEDEDYDVVNAECIDGVEDDEDTADEHDFEDTPFEEEEDQDVCFALSLNWLMCRVMSSRDDTYYEPNHFKMWQMCFQDASEASRREVAKAERDRLRKQDQLKRQRLEELRQAQNASAEANEVCQPLISYNLSNSRAMYVGWPVQPTL